MIGIPHDSADRAPREAARGWGQGNINLYKRHEQNYLCCVTTQSCTYWQFFMFPPCLSLQYCMIIVRSFAAVCAIDGELFCMAYMMISFATARIYPSCRGVAHRHKMESSTVGLENMLRL